MQVIIYNPAICQKYFDSFFFFFLTDCHKISLNVEQKTQLNQSIQHRHMYVYNILYTFHLYNELNSIKYIFCIM